MSTMLTKARPKSAGFNPLFAAFAGTFRKMRHPWGVSPGGGYQPKGRSDDWKPGDGDGQHRFGGGDRFATQNEKGGASSPSASPGRFYPTPTGFDCPWPYADPQFARLHGGGSDSPQPRALKRSDRKYNLSYTFARRLWGFHFRGGNPFPGWRTRGRKREAAYEPAGPPRFRETGPNVRRRS